MWRVFVGAEMQKGHTGVQPCDDAICNRLFNGECRCVALLNGLQVGTCLFLFVYLCSTKSAEQLNTWIKINI